MRFREFAGSAAGQACQEPRGRDSGRAGEGLPSAQRRRSPKVTTRLLLLPRRQEEIWRKINRSLDPLASGREHWTVSCLRFIYNTSFSSGAPCARVGPEARVENMPKI